MAQIHQATLTPTKLDLLAGWLPTRRWYPGEKPPDLERVGSCRFDDPAGEVGVEIIVVRAGDDGPLVHAPLAYRGAPLESADYFLIGTMEHSVLGTRWVYDATGDPVYLGCLAEAIRTGGTQADEFVQTPDGPQQREPEMKVRGTGDARATHRAGRLIRVQDGDPAVVVTETDRLEIRRVLTADPADGPEALTAVWPGQSSPVILAVRD